jgi:hypothetical protein
MTTIHMRRSVGIALLGAGLAATGCGQGTRAQAPGAGFDQLSGAGAPATLSGPATPVAVNCGPGRQALIRSSLIDGQAVSQVDCVAAPGAPASLPEMVSMTDYGYRDAAVPVYAPSARPAVYRTVQYEPARQAPARSGRTWQKSAIIIGSSAGVGAGVGAAVGGKKGALIGAAIGGGSAAIWDQATRR